MRVDASSMGVLFCLAAASLGCESPPETSEIEDYDADHGLRSLRHERGYDFAWVNSRMPHVVRVTIPSRDPSTGSRDVNECTGVVVGDDLVLTAAHCIRNTAFLSSSCAVTVRPAGGTGAVELDTQFAQDSGAGGPAAPPPSLRAIRRIAVREIVADPDTLAFVRADTGGGDPVCSVPVENAQFDGVLLRLSESVAARGHARVRTSSPSPDQLLAVIHHPGAAPKVFSAVRADTPLPAIAPGAHVADEVGLPGLATVRGGSSGAPLLDEEGYVLGLVSRPCPSGMGAAGCTLYASVASLLTIPSFAAALSPATEQSSFVLGRFTAAPFGRLELGPTSPGSSPVSPRRFAPRPEGGWLSVGFATNMAGEHIFALVAYDDTGVPDSGFGVGGHVEIDIPASGNEELFDVAFQTAGGETRPVVVGTLADPDSIAVARLTSTGGLDPTFGAGGVLRLHGGDGGASGAAIMVDPVDQSIVIAGHAAVAEPAFDGQLHGRPVVARLGPDGSLSNQCGDGGVFVWVPEGPGLVLFDTVEQLVETGLAPTYDMVVTDGALDGAGRIVLVGYLHFSDFHGRASFIARLHADCTPDLGFGSGGSGVRVQAFKPFYGGAVDNSWVSAIAVDASRNRYFVGGTLTAFDSVRGLFAGSMFVAAVRDDGSLDESGFRSLIGAGGSVVPRAGWHDETLGVTFVDPSGDEARVVLAGFALEDAGTTTRRVRTASFFADGFPEALGHPANPVGMTDLQATDVAVDAIGRVVVSLAHRGR